MNRMTVPYFCLQAQCANLRQEILNRLSRNASLIPGKHISQFGKEFTACCEAKYCVAANSRARVLHLALFCASVSPGDEVVTVPNSFIATAQAISCTGVNPVLADPQPSTADADPLLNEAPATRRTKAIARFRRSGCSVKFDAIAGEAARQRL